MTSLTIRLDKETESLLNQLSELLQQSKSTLAREAIAQYLEQQLTRHQAKQQLAASFTCDNKADVMQRIAESEAGQYMTDEEYEHSMDAFFAKELGLTR